MAVALLENAYRALRRAMDGLTEEQLHWRPKPHTNPIAWMAWHQSRWKDRYGALLAGGPEAWVSDGWAQRFGMAPERTGLGDTEAQVAAFHATPDLLSGYVEAAHRAVVERVKGATPVQWTRPVQYITGRGEPIPAWRAFINTAMDFTQHTGQIAYVRGLITGRGWLPV